MFEYNCSEMCSSCQGPDVKSRLIMTVTELRRKFRRSQKAIVRDFEKIVSPQSKGLRYPEHLCSPGLGAGAPTSTKPPISAAAEMSGFCILSIQMHCLHRFKTETGTPVTRKYNLIPLLICVAGRITLNQCRSNGDPFAFYFNSLNLTE